MLRAIGPLRFLAAVLAGWAGEQQRQAVRYLREENRVLREQLGLRRIRLSDDQRIRLAAIRKGIPRKALADIATLVTPQTLLSWRRKLIANKYDGSGKRGPADRPRLQNEIRDLVVRLAGENRSWGYTRIQGALNHLGHSISRGTIANILKENAIEPSSERMQKTTWREFLSAHWEMIAAADFFTIEIWTLLGLTRYLLFFVIELATRRVEIAGLHRNPDGAWMDQIGRNLVVKSTAL